MRHPLCRSVRCMHYHTSFHRHRTPKRFTQLADRSDVEADLRGRTVVCRHIRLCPLQRTKRQDLCILLSVCCALTTVDDAIIDFEVHRIASLAIVRDTCSFGIGRTLGLVARIFSTFDGRSLAFYTTYVTLSDSGTDDHQHLLQGQLPLHSTSTPAHSASQGLLYSLLFVPQT